MNRIPLAPIEFLGVGDIVSGQDGNKYVVCEKLSILYWEPYSTDVSAVAPSKPTPTTPSKTIEKVKEVKEKYYWKDNDKKQAYDGNNWTEMGKSLKPNVSPNKFPAGYVWTTQFSNISYVVDTRYKGCSTTMSRFWNVVWTCPPCLDANDYPFEYVSRHYYVDYDEQGNKFWCYTYASSENFPLQEAYKFLEGTTRTDGDRTTCVSRRCDDGFAWWDWVSNNSDSDDE